MSYDDARPRCQVIAKIVSEISSLIFLFSDQTKCARISRAPIDRHAYDRAFRSSHVQMIDAYSDQLTRTEVTKLDKKWRADGEGGDSPMPACS